MSDARPVIAGERCRSSSINDADRELRPREVAPFVRKADGVHASPLSTILKTSGASDRRAAFLPLESQEVVNDVAGCDDVGEKTVGRC